MLDNLEKFSLPDIEEKVLDFWRKNQIFKKAQEKNKDGEEFVFYEGPPTANGKPGIHHVLSRAFKDIVLRFQTMLGKDVKRRGGWDTHGLPVEIEVEKELGVNSKDEIEEYGIGEFNQKCRESVWEYKDEWEKLTERMGFWLDMEHPYITYENSYIDTVWWLLSQIDKKGYLYKSHKVIPWCPRCGTTLSSHELAQGYDEVTEPSVYMKFKLSSGQKVGDMKTDEGIYILSWTTTPWTLPGNLALAIGSDIDYVLIKHESGEHYLMAKALLDKVFDEGDYEIIESVSPDEIKGLSYEPLFDVKEFLDHERTYKIYEADFVTTEEGTGVVHTAVMYGEDDYRLGKDVDLPQLHTVDEAGKFNDLVPEMEGDFVKANRVEDHIFNHLKANNNLLRTEDYTHEYPFCWRCDTPVLYYAQDSWFIEMSKLRDKMLESNEDISWTPEHIKEGRFGEWLKGAKDWAISRERYWGTPLPIWQCNECEAHEVVGGFEDLSEKLKGANNNYILMRHGQAESNIQGVVNSLPENKDKIALTEEGRKEAEKTAKKIKEKKIDLIFSSDFKRTKQTAEILSEEIGVDVNFNKKIREINVGEFDGKPNSEYHKFFQNDQEKLSKRPPEGENLRDVAKRVSEFLEDLEEKYEDKNILIISHEYPIWMLETVMKGWGEEDSVIKKHERGSNFIETGQFEEVEYLNLPRNKWGIADPHRPYSDEVSFQCGECDGEMNRIEEVLDVWFDSGAMPFAQAHYPFENRNTLDYPAEYISEAIDQTRGWFYTLLSIATLMGRDAPYKNVISLGLVLDENGKKMSKSKGNTVDPWNMAETYGMDIVRWYFYTVNSPGEPKLFDTDGLNKVLRNFVLTFYNSFKFLNIYRDKKISFSKDLPTENVLDRWIISKLNEVIETTTSNLEKYDIGNAARSIEKFVGDLSRWYIRRSRERFQNPESDSDFEDASYTLSYCLLQVSKLISPFSPFISEAMYQTLKDNVFDYDFKKSVHLENWPKEKGEYDSELIENMKRVRDFASLALSQREKAQIKVRQPLQTLKIKGKELEGQNDLLEVLKEEVNVKEVEFGSDMEEEVELNTEVSYKLKKEGWLRDILRKIQGMRKSAGFEPGEEIELGIESDDEIEELIMDNKEGVKNKVGATKIQRKSLKNFDADKETKIENFDLKLTLRKL